LIPKESVLIVSRVGIGKFAVAPLDLCTSQDFTSLTTDQNPYFLAELFSFRKGRFIRMGQGTSIKGFTVSDIKGAKFYLPFRNEQDAIMKYLSLFDRQLKGQAGRIKDLFVWKQGLLQSLFV
jgi:type I restriction enzyme S subunit